MIVSGAGKMGRTAKPDGIYGGCGRKVRYLTWADAEKACEEIRADYRGLPDTYGCEFCGGWRISQFKGFRTDRNFYEWYRTALRGTY